MWWPVVAVALYELILFRSNVFSGRGSAQIFIEFSFFLGAIDSGGMTGWWWSERLVALADIYSLIGTRFVKHMIIFPPETNKY